MRVRIPFVILNQSDSLLTKSSPHADRLRAGSRWHVPGTVAERTRSAWSALERIWFALPRSLVVFIWFGWEFVWKTARWSTRDIPVPIIMPNGTCAVWRRRNRYEPYRFADGTIVARGAPVLEMHLRSRTLARVRKRAGWEGYVASDFAAIAAWLDAHPEVLAIVGESIITWAMRRFGAELRERPQGLATRFKVLYMTGVLLLFQAHGEAHVHARGFRLCEGWISRHEFLRRYLAR